MTERDIGILQRFLNELPEKLISFGIKIGAIAIICLIGLRVIKILRKVMKGSLERAGAEKGVTQFMDSCMKIGLYILLAFLILSGFGVDTASIIAVVGSLGLTVGLALQNTLSNFAAGVLILIMKPFIVGDYIVEKVGGNEGTVLEIQLFYTKLATSDNRVAIIPNATLANNSLVNATAQEYRRLDIRVGISYHAHIGKAKNIVLNILKKDEGVAEEKEAAAFVDELGASAVIIGCRFWVKTEDYLPAKWRITEEIKNRFDEENISIPFEQLDIYLKT